MQAFAASSSLSRRRWRRAPAPMRPTGHIRRTDGVEIRAKPEAGAAVVEKLGMVMVRILPDENPSGDWLKLVTPSGSASNESLKNTGNGCLHARLRRASHRPARPS